MINFPFLPVEGLHEFNLDWFLKKFSELQKEWDDTKAAWLALKEYVNTFFDNLDVQKEINNKLDEMYENGQLGGIIFDLIDSYIFPAFVDDVSKMTNKAIPYVLQPDGYIYTWTGKEWVNTSIKYGQGGDAIASSRINIHDGNVNNYNNFDTLTDNRVFGVTTSAVKVMENKPPIEKSGVLLNYSFLPTQSAEGGKVQIYLTTDNQMYTRIKWANTWSEWSNNKYGLRTHDTTFDANTVETPSIHYLYNLTEAKNLPKNFTNGMLLSLSADMPDNLGSNTVGFQFIITPNPLNSILYRTKWGGTYGEWYRLNNNGNFISSLDDVSPAKKLEELNGNTFYTMPFNVLKEFSDFPQNLPEANYPTVITRSIFGTPANSQNTAVQEILTYKYHLYRRRYANTWEPWQFIKIRAGITVSGTTVENYPETHDANTLIPLDNLTIDHSAFENENVTLENYPYKYTQVITRTNGIDGITPSYSSIETSRTVDEGVTFTRTNYNGQWQEWQADNNYHTHDWIISERPFNEYTVSLFMGDSLFTPTGGTRTIPGLISDLTNCVYYNIAVGGAKIDNTFSGSTLIKQINNIDNSVDGTRQSLINNVIISIGTNDTASTPKNKLSEYLENSINAILNKLPQISVEDIYIVSIMPRTHMARTVIYNALIMQTCQKLGVNFINGRDIPVIPCRFYPDLNTNTSDGLHYNDEGKEIIAKYLISKIGNTFQNQKTTYCNSNIIIGANESTSIEFNNFDRNELTKNNMMIIRARKDVKFCRISGYNKGVALFEENDDITGGVVLYYNENEKTFRPTGGSKLSLGTASIRFDTIYLDSAPVIVSDEKEKNNIENIDDTLKIIGREIKNHVKVYNLNNSDKKHIGFIAQEIVEIFNKHGLNAVDYNIINKENNIYTICYDELLCLIISSL